MKPDILTLCILATTILGSTRHVIGFLSSQTEAASSVAGIGPASVSRLSAQNGAIYAGEGVAGGGIGVGYMDVGDTDAGDGAMIQPRRHLNAQERNVYDPGDELLQALNAELGLELGMAMTPEESDYSNAVYSELELATKFDMLKKLDEDLRAEQELVDKSALLMKMLEDPTLDTLPLVYVEEEEPSAITSANDYPELGTDLQSLILGQTKSKRSRYYRRYPWKRHNRNRGNYEPEMRYACTPSKEDIFKLLVNLHENRKGNHSKTVNFCNRKRPAKAIFTNIRFLG